MTQAKAQAVAFDIIFADLNANDNAGDKAFEQAIAEHGNVIFPIHIEKLGHRGQIIEVPPAQPFYKTAAGIGHVHIDKDRDGVVRSVYLKEGIGSDFWPHFSLALLNNSRKDKATTRQQHTIPGKTFQPSSTNNETKRHAIVRNYLNYLAMPKRKHGLRYVSYSDVIEKKLDTSVFENKIIFVGATATGLGDILTTSVQPIPGVELNAWIFEALRQNRFIQKADLHTTLAINCLIIFTLLILLARLSPGLLIVMSFASILILLAFNVFLQTVALTWLAIAPSCIAILLFIPLWSWLRLEIAIKFLHREVNELSSSIEGTYFSEHYQIEIEENKKRQKPNKKTRGLELITQTLSQLEELKRKDNINRRMIHQSLEKLQDAVIVAHISGNIILYNKAFLRYSKHLTSSSNQENQYKLTDVLQNIIPENNKTWSEVLTDLYQTKQPFTGEAEANYGRSSVFYQGRLMTINSQKPDTVIITLTNISDLKAAEKSRMEALNFLSHDLRSPMVSVLAMIELYKKEQHITQKQLEPIKLLVQKNLDYADSFLHLSRAQSLAESQMHFCDLHSVIDSAQKHGLALAKAKSIKLTTSRTDEDAWVMGDNDLLERAVINLLSNAVKYSDENTEINLSLAQVNDKFEISVSDTGCGIAQQDIPTLFDRFTRTDTAKTKSGAGLGLYFVATVAKQHNGSVSVNSQENEGSVFTLTLPCESNND